jgi:hypothetical protein
MAIGALAADKGLDVEHWLASTSAWSTRISDQACATSMFTVATRSAKLSGIRTAGPAPSLRESPAEAGRHCEPLSTPRILSLVEWL